MLSELMENVEEAQAGCPGLAILHKKEIPDALV